MYVGETVFREKLFRARLSKFGRKHFSAIKNKNVLTSIW